MRKEVKCMLSALVLAGFSWGGCEVASAAGDAVYELNPVVVTATRTEKTDLDTPVNVQVISSKTLKDTGDSTVFQALNRVTGFNSMSWGGVTPDYSLSTSRATLRGFDKGTLVMVNGAPMNLLNYNTMAGIPVSAVDRVEVVKGASSVLYGSEAMCGVVNIITKKPEGKAGGEAGVTYGNYASDYHVSLDTGDMSLTYRRQFVNDIDLTSRKGMYKKNTNTGKIAPIGPNGLQKGKNDNLFLTYQISDKLNFNWNYYNQESNKLSYTDYSLKKSTLYKIADTRNNLNLIYNDSDSGLKSVLAYNKRRSYSDKYAYSTKKWGVSERYNMYSWTSDTQKKWDFRNGKDSLIAGFTFSRESYGGLNTGKTAWQSAYRNNSSIYASYSTEITPDFSVILGARGENIKDYAKKDNVFLPQIQALYKLNSNTSWYMNVGKAFQMPALNQYFSKPGRDFNNLKPQQGWTYETGLKWIDGKSSLKVGAYHIDFKDAFKWAKWKEADGTEHDYLTNAGKFRNTGVEIDYTHRINDAWSYNVGASFSNPEDNEKGDWKQDNARLQYTAGVTYDKDKWTANVSYVYLGDRQTSYYLHSDGSSFDISPSMDLSANFQYRPGKNHLITLTLDNILDKENSVNQYENLGLPYNYQISYSYKF